MYNNFDCLLLFTYYRVRIFNTSITGNNNKQSNRFIIDKYYFFFFAN